MPIKDSFVGSSRIIIEQQGPDSDLSFAGRVSASLIATASSLGYCLMEIIRYSASFEEVYLMVSKAQVAVPHPSLLLLNQPQFLLARNVSYR